MEDRKQMHQAVCDKCGQKCEVPFRPTSGKPVLCSVCFGNKGNKYRGRSGDRRMFEAVCDKCGNKCEVPFRPTAGKPIYCNNCFGKKTGQKERYGGRERYEGRERRGGRERHGGGNDQVFQQLSALSGKLDRVLSLLDSGVSKKEFPKKETGSIKPYAKGGSASGEKKPAAGKKPSKKAAKKKK